MHLFEYFSAFFAVYGLFWFVFALAPGHPSHKEDESKGRGDWTQTETVIKQKFAGIEKKRAA